MATPNNKDHEMSKRIPCNGPDPMWRHHVQAWAAGLAAWCAVMVLVAWGAPKLLSVDLSNIMSGGAKAAGVLLAVVGLATTLIALNGVGMLARWFARRSNAARHPTAS